MLLKCLICLHSRADAGAVVFVALPTARRLCRAAAPTYGSPFNCICSLARSGRAGALDLVVPRAGIDARTWGRASRTTADARGGGGARRRRDDSRSPPKLERVAGVEASAGGAPRSCPWSMDRSRRVPPSTRCTRGGTPAASQQRMSAMRGGFNGSTQRIHANDGKAGSALARVVAREARQFDHQRRGPAHAAGQARLRVHAPGVVELVFFGVVGRCHAVPAPSRTCTWQVAQAQTFSQACSMATPWASSSSTSLRPRRRRRAGPAGTARRAAARARAKWPRRGVSLRAGSFRPPAGRCAGRPAPRARGCPCGARQRVWCAVQRLGGVAQFIAQPWCSASVLPSPLGALLQQVGHVLQRLQDLRTARAAAAGGRRLRARRCRQASSRRRASTSASRSMRAAASASALPMAPVSMRATASGGRP
jgi:hypothetical protein